LAKKKGWHLAANGDGLFDENGKRIAGESEESIYKALDLPWQEPEER
jgi:DNA polymerase/3'-5' exonuclease PolX